MNSNLWPSENCSSLNWANGHVSQRRNARSCRLSQLMAWGWLAQEPWLSGSFIITLKNTLLTLWAHTLAVAYLRLFFFSIPCFFGRTDSLLKRWKSSSRTARGVLAIGTTVMVIGIPLMNFYSVMGAVLFVRAEYTCGWRWITTAGVPGWQKLRVLKFPLTGYH